LVVSRAGDLVPLPLVTLLVSCSVQAPASPGQRIVTARVTRLSALPFVAFEGKRQLLRAIRRSAAAASSSCSLATLRG